MCSRAVASFFWPGMTSSISEMRARCSPCNRIAPSQPNAPPTPPIQPQYPFQCVCADFFYHAGHYYLVIVDRYSNWPIVERAHGGSQGLISSLRRTFTTFGISDELSSDGGPEFTSTATSTFLRNWGVHHRLHSYQHVCHTIALYFKILIAHDYLKSLYYPAKRRSNYFSAFVFIFCLSHTYHPKAWEGIENIQLIIVIKHINCSHYLRVHRYSCRI
ncbi:RNA helicase [Plakobranchus ocellatus]|uniref:RNA helicase n=1 Tax=Plakobranchus ocellatus TaxID=259542 RepID=A0AAV4BUB0_9GAST|nr:RNA helicase [Plakobranchus ocellatus]